MKPLALLTPLVLVLLAALAFHTRYAIVAAGGGGQFPGAAYRLDRWTGRVQIISHLANETTP